jgi:asparagine synthase (glutamine-hydrolysing)
LHGWTEKFILRKAMGSLLPPAVAMQSKHPQAMDYNLQLSEVLDNMAATFLNPSALRERGFFDPKEIEALRRRRAGKPYGPNRAMRLWTALGTEIWARIFIDMGGVLGELCNEPKLLEIEQT